MIRKQPPSGRLPSTTHSNLGTATSGTKQDFTYKHLLAQEFVGSDFERSLFTGAVIEECRFRDVNFNRCDFAGTKFIRCSIQNCSFVPAEMRSCLFAHCTISSSNFGGTQWDNTQVEDSTFNDCIFKEASVRGASFSGSIFRACKLNRSSITLDRFTRCRFDETDFADCTALFLFFDDCEFQNSKMNAETIGFTFGLTDANISALKFLHLGNPQDRPEGIDLIDALISTYRDRKWYVGAAALELNFHRGAPVNSIRWLARDLWPAVSGVGRLDWDEIQFFARILSRLAEEERLPLLGLWGFARITARARENMAKEAPSSVGFAPTVELVADQVDTLLDRSLDNLLGHFSAMGPTKDTLIIEWKLHNKPSVSMNRLIPWSAFRLSGRDEMKLLNASPGSWIETWQLSLNALLAVQVSLGCVSGITGQMKKISSDLKSLFARARGKRGKSSNKKPPSRAVRAQKHNLLSVVLISRADEMQRGYENYQLLTPERLMIIDRLLRRLDTIPDDRLAAFIDYDASHTLDVHLLKEPPGRRQTKRSRTSANLLKAPKPASSKRSKLTRKAKP